MSHINGVACGMRARDESLEGFYVTTTPMRHKIFNRRFFAILHIYTPCPYLIGLVNYSNHMPSRPQTLVLYLSTDSCSVLSTCWGLYYFHVAPALVGTSAYDKPTLRKFHNNGWSNSYQPSWSTMLYCTILGSRSFRRYVLIQVYFNKLRLTSSKNYKLQVMFSLHSC